MAGNARSFCDATILDDNKQPRARHPPDSRRDAGAIFLDHLFPQLVQRIKRSPPEHTAARQG